VAARADQLATLSKISHQMFTSDETARLLEAAERENSGLPPESDDACLLVVARRDFDKATKLPEELVTEISRVTSLAQEEWAKAREANEYSQFAPWLERILDLQRRTADALGYEDRLYDALLNQYEYGMTSAELDPIFEELKAAVIPLARDIAERADTVSDEVLHRDYDEDLQRAFAERVLKNCGYDWSRGRQDRSVHPFCTNFGRDDVRITTRYNRNDLQSALFGSMHEMGHALYEQGIDEALDGTLLGGGTSLGVHESQSRCGRTLVGRSRDFGRTIFPALRETFPTQLADVDVEDFYRAMNRVNPSLIRVEADEVTYNLHIICVTRWKTSCWKSAFPWPMHPKRGTRACRNISAPRRLPIAKVFCRTCTGQSAQWVIFRPIRWATSCRCSCGSARCKTSRPFPRELQMAASALC
jgi:carboxypeptidase Taq